MSHKISVTNQQTGKRNPFLLRHRFRRGYRKASPLLTGKTKVRYMTVTAGVDNDHNIGLVSRELEKQLASLRRAGRAITVEGDPGGNRNHQLRHGRPDSDDRPGHRVHLSGIMVAQFQSLLSPFIVMFTIPLGLHQRPAGLMDHWEPHFRHPMLGFLMLSAWW